MDNISVEGKTNFFEHSFTEYQTAHTGNFSRDSLTILDDF